MTEDIETITINTDKDGRLMTRSQIQDYQLRGPEFENMNFMDYIVETYEVQISYQNSHG